MPSSMISRRSLLAGAAGSAGLALSPLASAQATPAAGLPNGPIRLIVGAPAGGGTDVIARLLAQHLGTDTGKSFIVDNKPGANGIIAADFVAKSPPDGQTIFVGISSHQLLNQLTYTKLPLNYRTDLARVYRVADTGTFITVGPKVPATTLQELVKHIEGNRGKVSYGSYGLGSVPHLLGERLSQLTQGEMIHVPYKGEAPMMQALLSGELDIGWATVNPLKAHAPKLRALATIGPKRIPALPAVPTFAEGGVKDEAFTVLGWIGLTVPGKTPAPIKAALAEAIGKVMAKPEIVQRIVDLGYESIQGDSPAKFEAYYKNDFAKWDKLVASVGVKLE